MVNLLKSALAVATIAALTACGGGGGGNYATNGQTYFSHADLASEFVRRLNIDVPGYNVTLTKTNTLQYDYIVVYDKSYKTYDAYYLGLYNPGENMAKYLNNYESKFYYDLISMGDGTYKDYVSGKLFEIAKDNGLDIDKAAAIMEVASIERSAAQLRETGMFEEAAQDVARFAHYAAKVQASGGSLDTKAFDRLTSKYNENRMSYSQYLAAVKTGNTQAQAKFLDGMQKGLGVTNTDAKLFSAVKK